MYTHFSIILGLENTEVDIDVVCYTLSLLIYAPAISKFQKTRTVRQGGGGGMWSWDIKGEMTRVQCCDKMLIYGNQDKK
jgi:hypothetical protein